MAEPIMGVKIQEILFTNLHQQGNFHLLSDEYVVLENHARATDDSATWQDPGQSAIRPAIAHEEASIHQ